MNDPYDEPSVMGAGCGLSGPPTPEEAIKVWRQAFAARLVERGVLDQEGANAYTEAAEVDLSEDPACAADDEISYWDADE